MPNYGIYWCAVRWLGMGDVDLGDLGVYLLRRNKDICTAVVSDHLQLTYNLDVN